MKNITFLLLLLIPYLLAGQTSIKNFDENLIIEKNHTTIKYKSLEVDGINIAYREAGDPQNRTIILLHGFPSSSHQYRKVLNQLSHEYHLVAPDYPGFGNSDFPSKEDYEYTFDNIANSINKFLEKKGINSYTIMMQDFGAPIGFRIATKHPDRVTAIINQNGNAYEEGLGPAWGGIQKLWAEKTQANREALYPAFTLEGMKWQYTHGTRNPENLNPDTWHLDYLRVSRPGARTVYIDMFEDYQNNLHLYPIWQKYLRDHQPPMLIVWGKNDEFFPESGAIAFKKDVKKIDYNIYDTGHFALEEDGDEIITKIRSFMNKLY